MPEEESENKLEESFSFIFLALTPSIAWRALDLTAATKQTFIHNVLRPHVKHVV